MPEEYVLTGSPINSRFAQIWRSFNSKRPPQTGKHEQTTHEHADTGERHPFERLPGREIIVQENILIGNHKRCKRAEIPI
jgi:hypothetical protein